MRSQAAGFTLAELLAVLLLVSLVTAGIGSVFATQNRAYVEQDARVALEEGLRVSLGMVTDTLRLAGCGVPSSHLDDWIPWVGGFTTSPVLVTEGGADPDQVSVAACTQTVARLAGNVGVGDTSLSLLSQIPNRELTELLNNYDKGLILIGDRYHARVKTISGNTVTVDTDPTVSGSQGLLRAFRVGTPITRIDVFTFEIEKDDGTGKSWLQLDKHHGSPMRVGQGLTDLQIEPLPNRHYRVTLTGQGEMSDTVTGAPIAKRMTGRVTLRNGST